MPREAPTTKKTKTGKAAPKKKGRTKTEWNLMFYIAGDSSGLSASMIGQLKELTDAGFQKSTRVLVYFDPNCNGRQARIFDVNRWRKQESTRRTVIGDGVDPYVRDIAEDCHIPGLPQLPAPLTLRYFLEYARGYYPARNYMVFLMGHGMIVANDAFLPDADDNSGITLSDLGWTLKRFAAQVRADGEEFHLVGFHSCSMSSVELAYELAGSAKYMMGTQGTAFPGSWPYRQLLKKTFGAIKNHKRNEGITPLVQKLLKGFQDLSFHNAEDFWLAGYSADLSICNLDTTSVGKLDQPLQQLSRALKKGLDNTTVLESIQLAHLKSQSYWAENYTDLVDFCECLLVEPGAGTAITNACTSIIDVLRNGRGNFNRLVVFSDYYGPAYQWSNGLSIYFPWKAPAASVLRAYGDYEFTRAFKKDSWGSFLVDYFIKTRRYVRSSRAARDFARDKNGRLRAQTPDWLRELTDQQLVSLGPPPPHKAGLGPTDPPGKAGLGDGDKGPPGKVGLGWTDPPGKVGLGDGDKGPPGKVGLGWIEFGGGKVGLGDGDKGPPGKVGLGWMDHGGKIGLGWMIDPPGKVGMGAINPPDKVGMGPTNPPGKVGTGFYGLPLVKNFEAPEERFVTSRRKPFSVEASGKPPSREPAGKQNKSRKAAR